MSVLAAVLAACGGGATAEGRLVDGMTGKPLAELAVVAKAAQPGTAATCTTIFGKTDAGGAYKLEGLCAGEYNLESSDPDLWLADGARIPDGGGAGLETKGYRAPRGSGIYVHSEAEVARVGAASRVKKAKPFAQDVVVTYPEAIPPKVRVIAPGEHLLLSGRDVADKMRFLPLVPNPKVKVGEGEKVKNLLPWSYLGVRFVEKPKEEQSDPKRKPEEPPDYRVEEVPAATPDPAKVLRKERGDRVAVFVAHDAVPEGRYGLVVEGDSQVTIVDFGKAFEPPPETAPEQTAEGG